MSHEQVEAAIKACLCFEGSVGRDIGQFISDASELSQDDMDKLLPQYLEVMLTRAIGLYLLKAKTYHELREVRKASRALAAAKNIKLHTNNLLAENVCVNDALRLITNLLDS